MKSLIISDINGNLKLLKKVIVYSSIHSGDRIILLGDYLDRGPDTPGTIDYIIDLKKEYEVIPLMGNHEEWFLRSLNYNATS